MRYTMIWLMMLGSVACIFRAEHMGIETLENLVRPSGALRPVRALFHRRDLLRGDPDLRLAADAAQRGAGCAGLGHPDDRSPMPRCPSARR
jgi:hypothetical protein